MKKTKIALVVGGIIDNGVTKVLSILLDEIDYEKYDVSVMLTKLTTRKRRLNTKARIIETQKTEKFGFKEKFISIFNIRKVLKTEKFEKVIVLGDYAAMYTLLGALGIKMDKIISERNDPNNEPDKKIYRILRDIIYKTADVIVCQTSDASDYYKKIIKKRVVIPNPINDDLPVYSGERTNTVVNFCRINKQKNLKLLVDSFENFISMHPQFKLEIYGDGSQKPEIEQYIKEKKLEKCVQMYGFAEDIHEKIKDAKMFVSSSDFEGMSNSMLEAMAIGLPSVCTDCPIGGAHEVIDSGVNGILVPVGDKNAMVNAMNFIADNPEIAEKISKESIKIRKTLSKTEICSQWWDVLEGKE